MLRQTEILQTKSASTCPLNFSSNQVKDEENVSSKNISEKLFCGFHLSVFRLTPSRFFRPCLKPRKGTVGFLAGCSWLSVCDKPSLRTRLLQFTNARAQSTTLWVMQSKVKTGRQMPIVDIGYFLEVIIFDNVFNWQGYWEKCRFSYF